VYHSVCLESAARHSILGGRALSPRPRERRRGDVRSRGFYR
jgi:hypothetical protein